MGVTEITKEEEKEMARLQWIVDNPRGTRSYEYYDRFVDKAETPNEIAKQSMLPWLGAVATTLVLINGLRWLVKGNMWEQQKMMRARIACQGFAFASCVAAFGYATAKSHYIKYKKEQRNEEPMK